MGRMVNWQVGRAFAGRGMRRMLRPLGVLDLSLVYRKDLAEPIDLFPARIRIEVSEATDRELLSIQSITGSSYHRPELLRRRISLGGKCLLARIEGEIVGFNWLTRGCVEDESYKIRLGPDDVYCMDAHTIERCRGHAIHTELLSRLLLLAQQMGYRYAFTRVSAMHVASWKSHLRLGWSEVGTTYLLQSQKARSRVKLVGPPIYPVSPVGRELVAELVA